MAKSFYDRILDAGVIGAGGAGFPTHIKVNAKADVVLANGAECEPLLRVDRRIMEHYPDKVVEGLQVAMRVSGAAKGYICLKAKYKLAVERLQNAIGNKKKIELFLLDNYYPAGDEQQIVHEVTGKVVPPGGIPLDVGAVVCNVGTLVNIADAVEDIPVTHKLVTVTGEVKNPITIKVPVGTPMKLLIKEAGGPDEGQGYALIEGGPAMGKVQEDWSSPVKKTTGGLIVLPSNHLVIRKKEGPSESDYRLTKSVCCQCSYCTQLCPRNNIGLGVQPHKVMRGIGYGRGDAIGNINDVFSCCDCGLCTYYACYMGLKPGTMVTTIKNALLKKGIRPQKERVKEVNPAWEYKKVPTERFIQRLGLSKYDVDAPMVDKEIAVDKVRIPLKQHIGVPATPVVEVGADVQVGDLIGAVEKDKVGANVHASIDGKVTFVSKELIEISARG